MASSNPAAATAEPELLDLTIDNITPNTIRINSQSDNARLKYVMSRLVSHLHDFARETRLSTDEWMAGLMFLIGCGKICSDVRNVGSPPISPLLLSLSRSGGLSICAGTQSPVPPLVKVTTCEWRLTFPLLDRSSSSSPTSWVSHCW